MDQLYLIEVLIDKIKYSSSGQEVPQKNEIRISVTFGDIANIEIEPGGLKQEFVDNADVFKAEVVIDSGKSYLFPIKADNLLKAMKQLPLIVSLIKKNEELWMGSATVPWTPEFIDLVETSRFQPEHVQPANGKGVYQISGDEGKTVGQIELFLKLSCLGRSIQTQFQIVEPKPILQKTLPKRFLFKSANAETTFQAQRYGEEGKSSEMLPVTPLYNPSNPEWQPEAPISPDDMTAEKINEMLCKNRDCPGVQKFKEFGLGPAATGKGLGTLYGPTDVPISYGMSHTYGNLENYGPYGIFTRPKSLDEPFIPKEPIVCHCGSDSQISAEGNICECGGPQTISRGTPIDDSCENPPKGGCCGGPLRLNGGAPGEDESKVPEPMMMCKDLMQSFDKVLNEYKKAIGPCGQVVCPFSPNLVAECCKQACQKAQCNSPNPTSQTQYSGNPANNNDGLVSACGVSSCPYSRKLASSTDKAFQQKQMKSACGSPMCPYTLDKLGNATDQEILEAHLMDGPSVARSCGSPKCPFPLKPALPPLEPIHWDCPDPLPKGPCRNPQCPLKPPELRYNLVPKGPCGNTTCPYATPPKCGAPSCPFGPPQPCPYANPPPCPPPSCEPDCGGPCCMPPCPPSPCPPPPCYPPPCPSSPCPPPPCCCVCGNAGCPSNPPTCGDPYCPLNPPALPCPGRAPPPCGPPPCPPRPCGGPTCPFSPPPPCSSPCGNPSCPFGPPPSTTCGDPSCPFSTPPPPPSSPCGNPTCPFAPPPSSPCGDPSCPFGPPPQPPSSPCGNPTCPFAPPPSSPCGDPSCPFSPPPQPPSSPCGNPTCPFAPPPSSPCGNPDCPFLAKKPSPSCMPPPPRNSSVCANPACPFAEKESNSGCGNPECPFATKKPSPPCIPPKDSLCSNPNCPYANPMQMDVGGTRVSVGYENRKDTLRQSVAVDDGEREYTSGDRDPDADLEPCSPRTCMAGDGNLECAMCRGDAGNGNFEEQIPNGNGKRDSKRESNVDARRESKRESKSAPAIGKKSGKKIKRNSASEKAIAKDTGGKKQKSKFVYKLGDLYPGTNIGHKTCVIPGRNVPAKMGWLWNVYVPCVGLKPRLGWRPGAVGRTIAKRIMAHRKAKGLKLLEPLGPKGSKRKFKSKYSAYESDSDATVAPKPTLLVQKREGCYYIIMNPLKDPKTIEDNENPYMDCTPLQFKITKKKDEEEKTCFCSGEEEDKSDSELDIEFTPPAGIIRPERLKRKKNVVHTDTQYNPEDFSTKDKKKGKDKGKKGKGGKGKKGKKK